MMRPLGPAAKSASWARRQAIWRHNGFHGSVAMARIAMRSIGNAETATDEAQELAAKIESDLVRLSHALINRRPEAEQ